uniref:Uncharacterized protein n=1 Tax=Ammopiptanthus mongolicus TaxID=126911 RepID=A0A4P8PNN8_AMMMO|nr:hypothetical protein [Ammopiptanthus mongolicus]
MDIQNSSDIVLYGHPTSSDIDFMLTRSSENLSLYSLSSTSSTRSDAQSAPPDLEGMLDLISSECTTLVRRSGREVPPEWTMPDLVRAVIGEEALATPGYMTDAYYDVMLHGQNAWLCDQIFAFLDLINYVF